MPSIEQSKDNKGRGDITTTRPTQPPEGIKVRMVFDSERPRDVLQARQLRTLYLVLDKRDVRMGVRGSADAPWHISKVMDVTDVMGEDIGKLGETCLGIVNGRHFHLPPGMPMYAQYLFDYIRFRHHLTAGAEGR